MDYEKEQFKLGYTPEKLKNMSVFQLQDAIQRYHDAIEFFDTYMSYHEAFGNIEKVHGYVKWRKDRQLRIAFLTKELSKRNLEPTEDDYDMLEKLRS